MSLSRGGDPSAAPAPRSVWWRRDSLFVRLLVLQIVLVSAVVLVFGTLFYVERSRGIARLQAHFWGPAVTFAMAHPIDHPLAPDTPVRRQRLAPPERALPVLSPRARVLRDAMALQGVTVVGSLLAPEDGSLRLWLEIQDARGGVRWIQMSGDLVESVWPVRLGLALLTAIVLLVGASWYFTRRLILPLQHLRARMDVVHPADLGAALPPPPDPKAPPEISAIAGAHHRLLERLVSHERERSLLLAGASHDLRSPLGRIRLAAQLLPEESGVARRRDVILRNVDVADALVESFLDHVRAGELPLTETVDLCAAVGKAAADRQAAGQAVDVRVPSAPILLMSANAVLVDRVFANLLDNACRHGRPPVRIHVCRSVEGVQVDVEDAGNGIPPAQRALALSAFGRGDASRGTPGTGLGLAIVQRVMNRLGGRLELHSEPGLNRVRLVWPMDMTGRGAGAA